MANEQAEGMIREIGRKYAKVLQRRMNLRSLYVFGSYVRGGHDNDSDIDIAVVADDFTGDVIEDTLTLMKLRRQVDMRLSSTFIQTESIPCLFNS